MDFQIINRLIRCSKVFSHREIRMHDTNETECMLCSYINAHPGCSQDEVAEATIMDKTTVAKALSRLEEKKLVERTRDPQDKRRNCLQLTTEGNEKLSGLIHIHDSWLKEIMTCLNKEEQHQFEYYCMRLLKTAAELTDSLNKEDNISGTKKRK